MSFCIFNQHLHRADGTQNAATSPMLQSKLKKPLVINSQMNPAGIASFFISMLAGAIVLTWLYNSTRGSLWIVALFHAMIELMFISKNITVQMSTYLGVTIMIGAVIIILLTKPHNLSLMPRQIS